MALVVKNPPANARNIKDVGSIPGLGRSTGGGHGNPLQYSCLENSIDRGAWWAIVHGVTESWTQLRQLSSPKINDRMKLFQSFILLYSNIKEKTEKNLRSFKVMSFTLEYENV